MRPSASSIDPDRYSTDASSQKQCLGFCFVLTQGFIQSRVTLHYIFN